jgi:hypothetical protein
MMGRISQTYDDVNVMKAPPHASCLAQASFAASGKRSHILLMLSGLPGRSLPLTKKDLLRKRRYAVAGFVLMTARAVTGNPSGNPACPGVVLRAAENEAWWMEPNYNQTFSVSGLIRGFCLPPMPPLNGTV